MTKGKGTLGPRMVKWAFPFLKYGCISLYLLLLSSSFILKIRLSILIYFEANQLLFHD